VRGKEKDEQHVREDKNV
jgi:hypothetical protein